MKTLEIEEGETQLVIKVAGSDVARVANKKDPAAVHQTLMDVLAEAPEVKPAEEGEDAEEEAPEEVQDIEEAFETIVDAAKTILGSDKAKQVKSFLGKIPKTKRMRERSG